MDKDMLCHPQKEDKKTKCIGVLYPEKQALQM